MRKQFEFEVTLNGNAVPVNVTIDEISFANSNVLNVTISAYERNLTEGEKFAISIRDDESFVHVRDEELFALVDEAVVVNLKVSET